MSFWNEKPLAELNSEEWESLCDGCGRCCVWKFEDEDTHEMLYTDIRCRLFNDNKCRCIDYENRSTLIPDCLDIRKLRSTQFRWLPESCAYRLLHEGRPLPDWHHLICGDKQAVHTSGHSLQNKTVCGDGFSEEDIIHHIIDPDEPHD